MHRAAFEELLASRMDGALTAKERRAYLKNVRASAAFKRSAARDLLVDRLLSEAARPQIDPHVVLQALPAEGADLARKTIAALTPLEPAISNRRVSAAESDPTWPETLRILWRGGFSWAGGIAAVIICVVGVFLWHVSADRNRTEQLLRKARETVQKEDVTKLLGRAFDALKQTNVQSAEALFSRVLVMAPLDAEAHYGLGEVRLSQKRPEDAAELFRVALKLNPTLSAAHTGLGVVLQLQGQDREAMAEFRNAIRLDEKDPTPRVNLANVLLESGNFGDAEQSCLAALDLAPDSPDALDTLGRIRLRQRNLPAAEQLLRKAASLETNSAQIQNNLGEVLRARGQVAEAQKAYEQALHLDPENNSAYNNLAIIYATQRNLPKAEEMLRQVLARSTPNSRLPSLVNLAIVCGDQGKLTEAEDLFREALAAAPDEPRILEPFAAFLADHGLKLEEALSFAQTAAQRMPDNPDILDTFGWVQLKRGSFAEAEKTLNKALQKAGDAPPVSRIRDHLKQLESLKNK